MVQHYPPEKNMNKYHLESCVGSGAVRSVFGTLKAYVALPPFLNTSRLLKRSVFQNYSLLMWKWGAGLLGSLWGENLRTARPTPVRKKVIYKQLSLLIQFCVGFLQLVPS